MSHYRRNRPKARFHQLKTKVWLFVSILCFLGCFVLMGIGVRRIISNRIISEEETSAGLAFKDMADADASVSVSQEADGSPSFGLTDSYAGDAPDIFPYFDDLISTNPDIVGLLGFGDSQVRYVCKGTDNFYYVDHKFDRTEHPAGMIFMDWTNSIWPRSDNLILYGHNMRDGSRFGLLKRYVDPAYLQKYPVFKFATLYELHEYQVISIFYTTVDPEQESYFSFAQTDFADQNAFDAYIAEIKERSIYEIPATAHYGDRLLTLATCDNAYNNGRLVIVCRATKEINR